MTEQELYNICGDNPDILAKLVVHGIFDVKDQSTVLYKVYYTIPSAMRDSFHGKEVVSLMLHYLDAFLGAVSETPAADTAHTMTEEELYNICMYDGNILAKLDSKGIFSTKEQSTVLYTVYCSIPKAVKANCGKDEIAPLLLQHLDTFLENYTGELEHRIKEYEEVIRHFYSERLRVAFYKRGVTSEGQVKDYIIKIYRSLSDPPLQYTDPDTMLNYVDAYLRDIKYSHKLTEEEETTLMGMELNIIFSSEKFCQDTAAVGLNVDYMKAILTDMIPKARKIVGSSEGLLFMYYAWLSMGDTYRMDLYSWLTLNFTQAEAIHALVV